jgi:hypothetical protein
VIDKEMIERLAIAGNGGSFANEYAKQYAVRILVKTIFAMTDSDAEKILAEVKSANKPDDFFYQLRMGAQ